MQKYEKLETLIEPVFILEGNLDIFFFFYYKQISYIPHFSRLALTWILLDMKE